MSENKGIIGLVWNVLRNPDEGFGMVNENDLMKGIVIEAVIVLLAVISTVWYTSKIPIEVLIPQLVGIDPATMPSNLRLLSGIGVGVSILLGWILSTLLMHGLSHLLGGQGGLRKFFAINGLAASPFLVNYLARTLDAYLISKGAAINYFLLNRGIESRFFKAVLDMNLLNIFGLYSLILVVIGLQENYKLSRGKALLIALSPWLLYFVLNFFTSG
ncbi:DUF1282 domain-containing protein [Candidatus Bathyarchaeota archaeon]|nr:DUF1282 domain-containing protein [Candidatus Bathyarchaeota archaeon]